MCNQCKKQGLKLNPEYELILHNEYNDELDSKIQYEGPVATGAAVVSAGFEILKSAISTITKGDINFTGPSSSIGVISTKISEAQRANTVNDNWLIIDYRKSGPWPTYIEQVNIKLRCYVQYNGPEIQLTFNFDAGGKRSRLSYDTYITIGNPLQLEVRPTSDEWKKIGINYYPVIRIPIEFYIDMPWPLRDNRHETFFLVVSGMYGRGSTATDREWKKEKRLVFN